MSEDNTKLFIEWQRIDSDPEHVMYSLACSDPAHSSLRAEISADEVTERAARAKLIAMVFEKARELDIDTSRLRFHV